MSSGILAESPVSDDYPIAMYLYLWYPAQLDEGVKKDTSNNSNVSAS